MVTNRISKKNQFNLWDALSLAFVVQRFFCIFPLKRQGNQIVYSFFATIYTVASMISYYSCIILASYLIFTDKKVNKLKTEQNKNGPESVDEDDEFAKSYLVQVIVVFEFIFNNVGIFVLTFFSHIKRDKQILFLQKIYDVDLVILDELKFDINYKRLKCTNLSAFLMIFSYYIGLAILILYSLYEIDVLNFGLCLMSTLYQFEQLVTAITTWTYINYVMLLRQRFKIIKERQENMVKEKKIMARNSIQFTENVSEVSTLLMTYKELCTCIDVLNDLSGSILILRITHDFTLTTSQVYLISWIIMDNNGSDKYELVLMIFVWMFQNIVKMGLTTLFTEMTIEEAKACSYTLNKSNKNSDDEDIQCMLDSFDLWLLHRKIEFNANNFFRIDLSLLYAVVGALASYVLILIQFKQQEETLKSDSIGMANKTNLNVYD